MDLKASLRRAKNLSAETGEAHVVGVSEGAWEILPLSDPATDQMNPAIIVDPSGPRYPEDLELVSRLIAKGQ